MLMARTVPAIIVNTETVEDGYVLVAHADYFLSFAVHGILRQAFNDISNNRYKHMKVLQLNRSDSNSVYSSLMNKYTMHKLTGISFSNCFGRNGVDFVPVSVSELKEITKLTTI